MSGLMGNLTHVGDSTPAPDSGPALEVGELALPLMPFQHKNVKEALAFPNARCLLASDMGNPAGGAWEGGAPPATRRWGNLPRGTQK